MEKYLKLIVLANAVLIVLNIGLLWASLTSKPSVAEINMAVEPIEQGDSRIPYAAEDSTPNQAVEDKKVLAFERLNQSQDQFNEDSTSANNNLMVAESDIQAIENQLEKVDQKKQEEREQALVEQAQNYRKALHRS